MRLSEVLTNTETRYKELLEMFFATWWGDTFLISHGIDHHRRVWQNARELLSECEGRIDITDPVFTDKLMIACYLHDIGMSADRGISHGRQSMEMCRRFLEENNLPESIFFDLLEAVENHDRKDYPGTSGNIDLFSLLSVADDLDAFGFTGVFRYIEIYSERGTGNGMMGKMVSENAAGRFRNFVSLFGFSRSLLMKNKKRYQVVDLFFNELSRENGKSETGEVSYAGYNGVIEYIRMGMRMRIPPGELVGIILEESEDEVIRWFFRNLEKEIRQG